MFTSYRNMSKCMFCMYVAPKNIPVVFTFPKIEYATRITFNHHHNTQHGNKPTSNKRKMFGAFGINALKYHFIILFITRNCNTNGQHIGNYCAPLAVISNGNRIILILVTRPINVGEGASRCGGPRCRRMPGSSYTTLFFIGVLVSLGLLLK